MKKNTLYLLALLSISIYIVYYITFNESEDKTNNLDTSFYIIDIDLNNKIGYNISVGISEKFDRNILLDIVDRVKNNVEVKSDRGKIFFFLPEMRKGYGAWARCDIEQDKKEIVFIGKSIEDEKKIFKNINNIHEYYGLWIDNFKSGDVIFKIQKKENKYFYNYISSENPNENNNLSELIIKNRKGKTVFFDKEYIQDSVYYELEENGNLSVYDNLGYISTYKRIK
jgi:hypothetical protein